ncbi:hypothetical protein SAMN05421823_101204 [Catalinimonas alkaloidigena]|uniref:ChbG/HpnK family deacetylase n=1 Tax=Catalinimonas alkaloidigena TaxID=1075417 RepID=A0A1G8WYK3_9BACT|nr:ChbG/HpnK family deacetylase [Catalinimonas alkaloidigena]SDJ82685.1 hypothetical protein SAMN05421823_101204 [Catalinimonas alkaloidigena]
MPLRLLFSVLVLLVTYGGCAQRQDIYILFRSDDIGFAHTVNEACIEACENGISRTVELMVPTPWFPEAVALLQQHPDIDVGIHLCLTSEWEHLKWSPLTHAPSLTTEAGYFHPFLWPNDDLRPENTFLLEQDWQVQEIEQELRAQIERATKALPRISHVSAHMGMSGIDPQVADLVDRLATEYGIDIDPTDYGVQRAPGFGGNRTTADEKIENLIAWLDTVPSGKWLFVDHPGYDTPELRAVGHKGYEHVAADRAGVTKAFTDPRVKAAIERRGIHLIAYRDLPKLH